MNIFLVANTHLFNFFIYYYHSSSASWLSFNISFHFIVHYSFKYYYYHSLTSVTFITSHLIIRFNFFNENISTHVQVYILTILAGTSRILKNGQSITAEDVFVWSTPQITSISKGYPHTLLLPGRCHRWLYVIGKYLLLINCRIFSHTTELKILVYMIAHSKRKFMNT